MKTALEQYDAIVAGDPEDYPDKAAAYFRACAELMDDDLREDLHGIGFPGVDDEHREFLRLYSLAHEKRHGVPFYCN